MINIISVPNSILRNRSSSVDKLDIDILQIIKDLKATLLNKTNPPGVGLSAIQIGFPVKIFLTLLPPDPSNKTQQPSNKPILKTYINPVIKTHSKSITLGENPDKPLMEGCLSIPRLWGPVWRHQSIEVEYQSPSADSKSLVTKQDTLDGFSARVFQHEFDHLNGILFTDYVLGQSPSIDFNPLGKPQPLYFEEEDEFVHIQKPQAILGW